MIISSVRPKQLTGRHKLTSHAKQGSKKEEMAHTLLLVVNEEGCENEAQAHAQLVRQQPDGCGKRSLVLAEPADTTHTNDQSLVACAMAMCDGVNWYQLAESVGGTSRMNTCAQPNTTCPMTDVNTRAV